MAEASGDPQYALATTDTLFEAPNSAGVHPIGDKDRKFYSIDFSLELERQLEMENTPVTPSFPLPSASRGDSPPSAGIQQEKVDASLDPEILAHIVTQLRSSLVEMTKERDELSRLLSESLNKEANLNDALQLMTEKATASNEELDGAKRKAREDEEAISMLRAKVEESRRGVMQLQKESRRQSMAPIDVNRASLLNAFAPSSSNQGANKRASTFTPLTGRSNSHRRISSVSGVVDFSIDTPNGQTLTFPDGLTGTSPPHTATRPSFIGRQPSPSRPDEPNSPPRDTIPSAELVSLRTEVQNLRSELQSVKHDLAETTEAREASENCVQALRQFIAESSAGDSASSPGGGLPLAMKLPPPPTMTNGSEEGDSFDTASVTSLESKKTAGGWGFKLWGSGTVDASKPVSTAAAPPQSAPAWGSPQLGNSTPTLPPGSATQPLSKKFGGFFSTRSASISSTSTSSSTGGGGSALSGLPPLDTIHQGSSSSPPVNPNAAPSHSLMMARHISMETTSSIASDTSSLSGSYVEPLSPGDDIHGLGNGFEYREAPTVMVRGETDGEMELLEEVDMGKNEGAPPLSKGISAVEIGAAR